MSVNGDYGMPVNHMESFNDVWLVIASKMKPGDEITNWSKARGYTGGTFKIEQVQNS